MGIAALDVATLRSLLSYLNKPEMVYMVVASENRQNKLKNKLDNDDLYGIMGE
jgi:hypothetical protein